MKVVIVGEAYFPDPQIGGGPVYPERPVDPGWGHTPGHPANRPPGSWGGPVDPGWGQRPPGHPEPPGRFDPARGLRSEQRPSMARRRIRRSAAAAWRRGLAAAAGSRDQAGRAWRRHEPRKPDCRAGSPEGTTILVWVSGVGYRYVTIGEAEPK